MSRTLKHDIPGHDWRVSADDVRAKGIEGIFAGDLARPLPLVLEIGFGRGEFLLGLAEADAGQAFLGVEYSRKRVLKTARRLARTELRNVRLLLATAEEVIRDLLPAGSVASAWVNFPDPWPKKRHHKRRIVQDAFVALVAERLVVGGTLNVATDWAGYAEHIDEVLSRSDRFTLDEGREHGGDAPLDRPRTKFERRGLRKGHRIFDWRFVNTR